MIPMIPLVSAGVLIGETPARKPAWPAGGLLHVLDALIQDLRYAIRTLRASPGFAAVAILSLALGIGANTAIFSLIDAVMLKYLPVSHPEELLQLKVGTNGSSFTNPI